MRTFRLLTTVIMIFTLVLSSVQTVRAEPTPPLPSAFHGTVKFYDSPPSAGDLIYAYVPGVGTPVASDDITTYGSDLVYAISVPGDISDTTGVKEGGAPGDTITFIINGRQVATALWAEGTSVTLNIHPPQALPGGPYTVEAGANLTLDGHANDYGFDTILAEWDLDGDAAYDDAIILNPNYSNPSVGTYTIGLRATDSQGGIGTASTPVFVYTLGGISGQEYDGNAHPVTVSGIQSPYSYNVTYDGSATAPTNAGTYVVVVHIMNGASEVTTITTTLVIAQKAASVTPNAAGKTYGESDPVLSGTLVGFLGGDNVNATYSRTAGESVAGSPYTISAILSPAGVLGNYAITYNTAAFTIAARAITVNAEAKTKVYGEDDPALTYTYTGTLVSPDVFSGALSRVAGEDVGSYAILQNTLTLGTNYAITYNGANLSITPAAATITLAGLSQTFDGTPRVVTATTVPAGLTVTITYNGSTTAPTDAGTYAIVATINELNYAGTTSGTLVVAKAPSVTTVTGGTFGYDGLPHPATVSVTGVGGLSLTPAPVYSGACSAAPVNVADTPCTASYTYAGDANHEASSDSDTITITPATATVTLAGLSQTFDGTARVVTTTTVPAGLTVSITYDGSTTPPINAGTYAIVATVTQANYAGTTSGSLVVAKAPSVTTVSGGGTFVYDGLPHAATVTVTGVGGLSLTPPAVYSCGSAPINVADTPCTASYSYAGDTNHEPSSGSTIITITPAAATVSLAGLSQTYDGSSRVVTATTNPVGLSVTITYEGSTTAPINAGTYAVVATITNTNYAGSSSGSLVVERAPSVTTVSGGGTFVYDRLPHAATVTVTGVGGLSLTPAPVYSCSAAPVNVADTPCTASYSYAGDTNHEPSSGSTIITITTRAVTVTADPQTKVYGNADPTLTYQVTAGTVVSGDTFSGSLTRDSGEAVGPYNITQGGLTLGSNYALTYAGDTLTITLRPIEITADNKSKIIGTAEPALTYSITDGSLAFSDAVTGDLVRVAGEAIGTYAINQGTVGINANYNLTFVPGVFEITGVQHSLVLQPGWNLVSFAINPASTLVTDIFAPIDGTFDLVYAWDASVATPNNWLKYDNVLVSSDNLVNLTAGMGFWIHIIAASPVTLTVSGTLPTSTSIQLYVIGGGWNLIGYPSDASAALPGALTSLEPNYSLVFSYRALDTVDPWKMYDRIAPPYASDLSEMAPGWGYWIKVSALDTLEVTY